MPLFFDLCQIESTLTYNTEAEATVPLYVSYLQLALSTPHLDCFGQQHHDFLALAKPQYLSSHPKIWYKTPKVWLFFRIRP